MRVTALLPALLSCTFLACGAESPAVQGREPGAVAAQLEDARSRLRQHEAQLREQSALIAAQASEIGELRRKPFRMYTMSAAVELVCDKPALLRPPLSPDLDRANPRIGTRIRLMRSQHGPPDFFNMDLDVQYREVSSNAYQFVFNYELLRSDQIAGQSIQSLGDVTGLHVSYRPVLRSLGYCVNRGELAFFSLNVNGSPVVTLPNIGSFVDAPSQTYDVSGSFEGLAKRYTPLASDAEAEASGLKGQP